MKIGISVGGVDTAAEAAFVESLAAAAAALPEAERPELFLVAAGERADGFSPYRAAARLCRGICLVGGGAADADAPDLGGPCRYYESRRQVFGDLDFIFALDGAVWDEGPSAVWITDFSQHYLPELFTGDELARSRERSAAIAAGAKLAVFGAPSAKRDFERFYPLSRPRLEVLVPCVWPQEEWYRGDAEAAQRRYGLPERFVLCPGQFAVHKNHVRLFQAMGRLWQAGNDACLVCCGHTHDRRAPGYYEALTRFSRQAGWSDNIRILGPLPRQDEIQLMRRSLCVVQPSLQEGQGLVQQECLTLGKALVVSDLPVYRDGGYGVFFAKEDAGQLAAQLAALTAGALPGPDCGAETAAKLEAQRRGRAFAQAFCRIAREGCAAWRRPAAVFPAQPPAGQAAQEEGDYPVTLATTIGPRELENQAAAIASWQRQGFRIAALNPAEEIAALRPHFPGVDFVAVERHGGARWGKPYIYLDDVLAFLRRQPDRVCGIINSDTYLGREGFKDAVYREALDSFVFGARFDVKSMENTRQGKVYTGFDYFIFDKRRLPPYPPEEFCLGLPWWDYWIVLAPLAVGVPAKRVVTPCVFHPVHPVQWSGEAFNELAACVARYAPPSFAISEESLKFYGWYIYQVICEKSTDIIL